MRATQRSSHDSGDAQYAPMSQRGICSRVSKKPAKMQAKDAMGMPSALASSGVGTANVAAFALEHHAKRAPNVLLVVDDQHRGGHGHS